MQNISKISLFYLRGEFKASLIMMAVILVLHLIIAILVSQMENSSFSGIIDVVAPASIFALGISMFLPSFRYLLSQSFSRKTFFVSTVTGLALAAGIYTLLITVYFAITMQFGNNSILYSGMYQSRNIAVLFLWEFSFLFMMGMVGWCARTITYVAGRFRTICIAIGFLVLLTLGIYSNVVTEGVIFATIGKFITKMLGVYEGIPNPYIASGSFLLMTLITAGIIFVLIRRAQVKD